MTVIDVTNETPVVHECSESYRVCGMCRYSKYCLLQPIKRAEEIPKLFDILNIFKLKLLMLLKGIRND
jgi:hypothetical protein